MNLELPYSAKLAGQWAPGTPFLASPSLGLQMLATTVAFLTQALEIWIRSLMFSQQTLDQLNHLSSLLEMSFDEWDLPYLSSKPVNTKIQLYLHLLVELICPKRLAHVHFKDRQCPVYMKKGRICEGRSRLVAGSVMLPADYAKEGEKVNWSQRARSSDILGWIQRIYPNNTTYSWAWKGKRQRRMPVHLETWLLVNIKLIYLNSKEMRRWFLCWWIFSFSLT